MIKKFAIVSMALALASCQLNPEEAPKVKEEIFNEVIITSEMRNVMWNGELAEKIHLDTIANKQGLMGLGPLAFLKGEITICDGVSYVSRVETDSTMVVEKSYDIGAPFFVHSNVKDWTTITVPDSIKTISDLESFIVDVSEGVPAPFAFKVEGEINSGIIHIQNLADGSVVSSPKEAHAGQVNYALGAEQVKIVGFYSQEHQAVFTHHDTFLHLHLITVDEQKMGHLDEVDFGAITLFLPKKVAE